MPDRRVDFTPYFTQNFKHLQKRYHHIGTDLHPLIDQLKRGETPGDQVPGVGYAVYKIRVRNSDARRGKSGGYRVVYYLKTERQLLLLTIYSKSDHSDIPAETIRRIIEDYEAQNPPDSP